jgi:tetratricopeptide (TPR) repeat protein
MEQVKALDPFSPYRTLGARWLYYARQPEAAMEECEEWLALFPDKSCNLLGLALAQEGRYARAIEELEKAVRIPGSGPPETSALAQVYAGAGRTAEARTLLEQLEGLSQTEYVPPHLLALVHAALGQDGPDFSWLERGYESRDPALIWANVDPGFEGLRSDLRFRDLVRRMHLAE